MHIENNEPADSISFNFPEGLGNRISPHFDEEETVEHVLSILCNERQQGDNIVLYINDKVKVDHPQDLPESVLEIAHAWNNAIDSHIPDPEEDLPPQFKVRFEDNHFRVEVETYQDGETPFETAVSWEDINYVIGLMLTTGYIYDCYSDPILNW